MRIDIPDFDIRKTAESGQCFRIRPLGQDGAYSIVAGGRYLEVRPLGGEAFDLSCTPREWEAFWRAYFDMDTDYAGVLRRIDPDDAFLCAAARYGRGIRILRQDAFETTVCFIISQRKNIKAIEKSVDALCERFGEPLPAPHGGLRAFPAPERLACLTEADLADCSLGYRDKYVLSAARAFTDGGLSHRRLTAMGFEKAREALLSINGVGIKVANCILLFALHDVDAFPVDVWIARVLEREYGGAFPLGRYEGCAGIVQQYMFYYARGEKYARAAGEGAARKEKL